MDEGYKNLAKAVIYQAIVDYKNNPTEELENFFRSEWFVALSDAELIGEHVIQKLKEIREKKRKLKIDTEERREKVKEVIRNSKGYITSTEIAKMFNVTQYAISEDIKKLRKKYPQLKNRSGKGHIWKDV